MESHTLTTIEAQVRALAARIGAPDELLPTFGRSEDFARPHIEVDARAMHFVVVERGQELERVTVTELDELLRTIFCSVTFSMACAHELRHRRPGKDARRVMFAHQVELLGRLSGNWAERERAEHRDILSRHPFNDVAM